MKNHFKWLLFSLVLLLILNACALANKDDNELFKYRGSYVGDHSAVLNIIKQLPQNKLFKKLSLYTKKEPYGMVIQYGEIKGQNQEKTMRETVITNATYLFALIKNAEWVTFDFNGQKYKVTRTKLENWYGEKMQVFTNEADLRNALQTNLNDQYMVNQFFKKKNHSKK